MMTAINDAHQIDFIIRFISLIFFANVIKKRAMSPPTMTDFVGKKKLLSLQGEKQYFNWFLKNANLNSGDIIKTPDKTRHLMVKNPLTGEIEPHLVSSTTRRYNH